MVENEQTTKSSRSIDARVYISDAELLVHTNAGMPANEYIQKATGGNPPMYASSLNLAGSVHKAFIDIQSGLEEAVSNTKHKGFADDLQASGMKKYVRLADTVRQYGFRALDAKAVAAIAKNDSLQSSFRRARLTEGVVVDMIRKDDDKDAIEALYVIRSDPQEIPRYASLVAEYFDSLGGTVKK